MNIFKKSIKTLSSLKFGFLFIMIFISVIPNNFVMGVNESFSLTEISSITNPDHISAIQVVDDLLYLSDHVYGLKIYNFSDPSSPSLLGQTSDTGIYHDMFIEGDRAYFADLEDGLVVFDISDPTNITRIGSFDVGEQNAAEIHVVDDIVYLAEFGDLTPHALEVFNVSNPASISSIGNFTSVTLSYCVQIIGNYCYITGGSSSLIILDITDPSNPTFVSQYFDGDAVRYFYVNDGIAYVTCWDNGIKLIDVSDPNNPQLLSEYSKLDIVISIYQIGDYCFVGEWWQGMATIDVSDPSNPQLVHNFTEAGGCTAVYATEEFVFVGAGNQLKIMDYEYQTSTDNGKDTPFNIGFLGLLSILIIKKRKK